MNVVMRYLIHELVHVFQHEKNEGKVQKEYKEYLDDPDEREAFSRQIQFHANTKGERVARKYVKELLDFHKVPESDKKELKKTLLKEID